MFSCTKFCVKGTALTDLEAVTGADKFELDCFCTLDVSDDESDALRDLKIAKGFEW